MSVYYTDDQITLHHGDALNVLRGMPDRSVNCCMTSPPYFGLRDYGVDGQYGLEETPAEYVENMRILFAEVRRVLAADGTLWLNLGDSYSGSWGAQGKSTENAGLHSKVLNARQYKHESSNTGTIRAGMPPAKNLLGIPWRVAFALQDDGWILRNAIIWSKPNAMPESVTDRLSNRYEHLFLFSRSRRYWFNLNPIREPHDFPGQSRTLGRSGREGKASKRPDHELTMQVDGHPLGKNPGNVWTIPTTPFPGAHFAVMPVELARRAIAASCKPGGTVLDPFSGTGTTGLAANQLGYRYIGIELSAKALRLSLDTRLRQGSLIVGDDAW